MKKILLLTFLLVFPVAARAAAIKVIVHPSNSVDSLAREKVADMFLKKVTRWDNGRSITPVDQSEKNPVRQEFCRVLLVKEVAWVKSYWQKMIFSGRATPPAELASDAEVVAFVRSNPDSIGYVSEETPSTSGVKLVAIKD